LQANLISLDGNFIGQSINEEEEPLKVRKNYAEYFQLHIITVQGEN
jgi:hypothetical protein